MYKKSSVGHSGYITSLITATCLDLCGFSFSFKFYNTVIESYHFHAFTDETIIV